MACRVDLCHHSNDDDEDDGWNPQDTLLEKTNTTDSSTSNRSRCFSFMSIRIGSRQKVVILVWYQLLNPSATVFILKNIIIHVSYLITIVWAGFYLNLCNNGCGFCAYMDWNGEESYWLSCRCSGTNTCLFVILGSSEFESKEIFSN